MSTVAPAFPVLADRAFPVSRSFATDAALVVTGAATVGLLAQVTVPLWPVPVTGQTLGVALVALTLGARRGAAALSLYLVVGLLGLPVFAGAMGGPLSVLKPSFGFIIGFIAAAYVGGKFAERSWDRRFGPALAAIAATLAIPYLFGLPYLAVAFGMLGMDASVSTVVAAGVTPFLLGEAIKAVIAAAAIRLAWTFASRKRD